MRTTMECDFSIFICIELPNELMYSNGKKKNKTKNNKILVWNSKSRKWPQIANGKVGKQRSQSSLISTMMSIHMSLLNYTCA